MDGLTQVMCLVLNLATRSVLTAWAYRCQHTHFSFVTHAFLSSSDRIVYLIQTLPIE